MAHVSPEACLIEESKCVSAFQPVFCIQHSTEKVLQVTKAVTVRGLGHKDLSLITLKSCRKQ